MKIVFSRSLLSSCLALLMLGASTQSLSAAEMNVIGSLEARGQIQVLTDSAPAAMNLRDTTYAYIAGDRVKTGSGTGMLTINGLGRIGLASNSDARVIDNQGGLSLELNAGTVAYALTPGSDFSIKAAGMTLHPVRTPLQNVSDSDSVRITGWVTIDKDGKVQVGARDGRIEVRHAGTVQVVEAGQQSQLQLQQGKLIATANGAGAGGGIGGMSANTLLLITAVIAGGIAAAAVTTGNDTKNLASP